MLRIPDTRLEYFLAEDVPYIDLTTEVLGIGNVPGQMEYYTREACVVAGVDEVERMAKMEGCEVEVLCKTGEHIAPGDTIVRLRADAARLHRIWKVGLNLLDHLSAVATKTHGMVEAVHAVNSHCQVLVTRKNMPGCKDLLLEAVMAGGAFPHRLGLSETVLVFGHHMAFLGGCDVFVRRVPEFRQRCIEKKLIVEAPADQARRLVEAGVDGIQFDKVPTGELAPLVKELRAVNPQVTLIAAGGITPRNAAAYAAAGVDCLATTSLLTAPPLDMSVRMAPL